MEYLSESLLTNSVAIPCIVLNESNDAENFSMWFIFNDVNYGLIDILCG